MGSNTDHLAERRYVTVVLRLVVDSRGRLVQGEALEPNAARPERFKGWRGLSKAVQALVGPAQR